MNSKKLLLFCLCCLLLLFPACAKELTVMSFNIQGHGPGSSEHRKGKEEWENQIIAIIQDSKANLVLLQEVPIFSFESENLAQKLAKKLNGKESGWKSVTSAGYALCSMDLNNAVLYNEKYVTFVNDMAGKEPFNMRRYGENQAVDERRFKFIKNNEQILEFSCNGKANSNFYLVNVHLPGPDESEKRYEERRILADLYAYCKRKCPIILAGDFNFSRKELIRGSNFSDAIIDGKKDRYVDEWGQKTTVKESSLSFDLSNDYDHFIVSSPQFFSVSEQMHLVFSKDKVEKFPKLKVAGKVYTNGYDFHRGLSDHLPIMIKLKY